MKYAHWIEQWVDLESHPARGGWIEIVKMTKKRAIAPVPPRTGWVD